MCAVADPRTLDNRAYVNLPGERRLSRREREMPFGASRRDGLLRTLTPPSTETNQQMAYERDADVERREGYPPQHGAPPPAHRGGTGLATAAVVLGVIALIAVIFTFGGLFFLALPLGIAAMIMGSVARRRAESGAADPRGRGRARAGFITGLIATILSVLVGLLIAAGIALLSNIDLEGLPDEIENQVPEQLQDEAQQQIRGNQ